MEELELTPEYLKAFNDGYLIAKNMPELSKQLATVKGISPTIMGLKDGRDQYTAELEKERFPAWLRKDRFKEKLDVLEKTKDKDKDMDEPDLVK